MLLPKRIWKDIKGYEGYYQVANIPYADKRQVRSVDHWITTKDGRKVSYKGRLLKPGCNELGYMRVVLAVNGRKKNISIHRLVALHFVDGYFEGAIVNHKDENPSNNIWTNLEWCTYSYNNNYGTRKEKCSKALKGRTISEEQRKNQSILMTGKMVGEKNHKYGTGKSVMCIELNKPFISAAEVAKWIIKQGLSNGNKCSIASNIKTGCDTGKLRYGYHWEYI